MIESNINLSENKQIKSYHTMLIVLSFVLFLRQMILLLSNDVENTIATILFKTSMVVALVTFLLLVLSNERVGMVNAISFVMVSLILSINWKDFSENTNDIIAFILVILIFNILATNDTNSKYIALNRLIKVYKFFLCAIALVLCVGAFMSGNYEDDELLYYTYNPNQSALLLLCVFINIYIFRFCLTDDSPKTKRFYNFILIGLTYACYKTESRTALICIIICLAFIFIPNKNEKLVKTIVNLFFILIFVLPLMISTVINILGEDFQIFGETIATGRNVIWSNVNKDIFENVFATHIGESVSTEGMDYYGAGLGNHNVFLEISWRHTIFVAILFLACFKRLINNLFDNLTLNTKKYVMACICAISFHMTMESSLFVGAFDYSMWILLPLILVKYNNNSAMEKEL